MIDSVQINHNITLYYIPMQKLKTTTFGLYIHRPLCEAEVTMNAVLPYVLKRGCGLCRDAAEVARYLEELYGAKLHVGVTKKGDNQTIVFDAETISDCYAPAGEQLSKGVMELLLSILLDPVLKDGAFDGEYVAQEKANAADRIESLMNDKRAYARMRCIEEMCKGRPYELSALGRTEDMDGIDAKNLYEHYKKVIPSSVIDIFVCGDADMQLIEQTIREKIRGISFTDANLTKTQILTRDGDIKKVTERMEVTQGKLAVGFRTNVKPADKEFWALVVANSVFGAGTHSKLFNNVREKLSLAYYASSQIERFNGLLVVNAGIEFSNFQKAYDEILAQFEAVKKGEVTDMEYESSIKTIINSLNSYDDDQRYMRNFYLDQSIAQTGCDLEEYKARIKAVTKQDCIDVFQKVELDTVYFLTGEGDAQ